MHYILTASDSIWYLVALVGLCGAAGIAYLATSSRNADEFRYVLLISFLWQVVPTLLWLYFLWDGPSTFFHGLEIAVLVVVPALAGAIHRSWKVVAASFFVPVVAMGLMMAAFIVIMGNGR